MRKLALQLSIRLTLGLLLSTSPAFASSVVIDTADGPLQGLADGKVESFKGIPFAQPPLGDRRWRPPESPKSWKSTLIADHYGPDCMQIPFAMDDAMEPDPFKHRLDFVETIAGQP